VTGVGIRPELVADLVEDLERLAPGPVELVEEGEERDAPVAAHLEQLAGLRLDALGHVEHHHGGVDGGEDPVGVLEKSRWPGVSSRLTVVSR
jgi:hypothetical protein